MPAYGKVQFDPAMVAEGHYAVPANLLGWTENPIYFFRVDKPTEGRWAGYLFVKHVIGGHPRINVKRSQKNTILQAILKFGVDKAGQLYGDEIGQCRDCNRELTKYASRKLARGRTCAGKAGIGDLWDEIEANAPREYYQPA
jgi:hypothetical protein